MRLGLSIAIIKNKTYNTYCTIIQHKIYKIIENILCTLKQHHEEINYFLQIKITLVN